MSNRNVFRVCRDKSKGVKGDARCETKIEEARHRMTKVLSMVGLLLNKEVIPLKVETTIQVDVTPV